MVRSVLPHTCSIRLATSSALIDIPRIDIASLVQQGTGDKCRASRATFPQCELLTSQRIVVTPGVDQTAILQCSRVQQSEITITGGNCTRNNTLSWHHYSNSAVQYSTVQYSTVQYSNSTVQYSNSTVQYSTVTVQYSTVQYSTVQYSTVQYSTVTVQYSTVQYSTVQYSTVQYSTVQYSTVHWYETFRYTLVRLPVTAIEPKVSCRIRPNNTVCLTWLTTFTRTTLQKPQSQRQRLTPLHGRAAAVHHKISTNWLECSRLVSISRCHMLDELLLAEAMSKTADSVQELIGVSS